ncbi:carbohydrate kinase [Herbiconiux sp. CPCC 205716]|uniref:Carbohydrate kinase n=1 Tax=Herbiconiux gentiana TaxID=2970912 RepID=A0ABT2GMJ0_9MICO|nr:carbohydrate kinase [Herbiconiux gentiana]MCS5715966.1 carbohydrate kinase [Herbiconiux gentiana]
MSDDTPAPQITEPIPGSTTIVAIGEALVDVVQRPGAEPVEHPGGSPMNIALGLARLGRPVTLVTEIGTDDRGAAIAEHVRSAGVALAPGSIRDEPTSSATAHLGVDGSASYTFDLRWSLPAGLAADDPALTAAGIVHAGSIAAFLEPGGSEVAALLTALAAGETPPLITFDPNIRPSIVPDHATVLARFEQLAALTTLLKLSDEDAEWLYPGAGPDEAADRILELGPAVVAVTRGGDGALLATAEHRRPVPGVAVEVADTIGAGDSFMSALIDRLAGLVDEGVPLESLRDGHAFDPIRLGLIGDFAVRCAAITVSRPGANPPTRADIAD